MGASIPLYIKPSYHYFILFLFRSHKQGIEILNFRQFSGAFQVFKKNKTKFYLTSLTFLKMEHAEIETSNKYDQIQLQLQTLITQTASDFGSVSLFLVRNNDS